MPRHGPAGKPVGLQAVQIASQFLDSRQAARAQFLDKADKFRQIKGICLKRIPGEALLYAAEMQKCRDLVPDCGLAGAGRFEHRANDTILAEMFETYPI